MNLNWRWPALFIWMVLAVGWLFLGGLFEPPSIGRILLRVAPAFVFAFVVAMVWIVGERSKRSRRDRRID